MLRLFVGLEIPDIITHKLALLTDKIPGAQWTAARNYHMTLSFIGEVEALTAKQITFALPYVEAFPFVQRLKGIDVFEENNAPHILYATAEITPPLSHLKTQVDKALRLAGIDIEHQRYIPHVTLARLHDAGQEKLNQFREKNTEVHTSAFPVKEFILYQSHKDKDGLYYEPIQRYSLKKQGA